MNKKDQIYEAALVLFNENGFDKTPTSQIAKKAGVAIGTLFHYFKTKEELINSLYLRCKESMLEKVLIHTAEEDTFRDKIKRLYVNFLEWGLESTEEFMFFQQFSNSVYIHDATRAEGKNKFEVLRVFLKEGEEKELIKNAPCGYLLSVATGIMLSNINYFIANRHLMEDEAFIEQTFHVLWDSVKN